MLRPEINSVTRATASIPYSGSYCRLVRDRAFATAQSTLQYAPTINGIRLVLDTRQEHPRRKDSGGFLSQLSGSPLQAGPDA